MIANSCLTNLKVAVLTLVVVASFLFTTILWRHLETSENQRILVGAIILICMYALMIFELINRNLAALIGAAVSVAAHDCLISRVNLDDIVKWEDLETLALLFGMMSVVNVLSCSGLFHYLAIWAYRKSNGRFWLLMTIMSFITAFLSAFIDNVSTMLLISPTLIKLGELEHVDPRYILMTMVLFSNIGGCATPVGDPPNLIIIGDQLVQRLGISFGSFTAYCAPCVLITVALNLIYLRLIYKSKEGFRFKNHEAAQLKILSNISDNSGLEDSPETGSELKALYRIEEQLSRYNCETFGSLIKQVQEQIHLEQLKLEKSEQKDQLSIEFSSPGKHQNVRRRGSRLTESEMSQLMLAYTIRDRTILVQSVIVLVVAVLFFFIQSIPGFHLTLGWISLFAGLTLMVLCSQAKVPKQKEDNRAIRSIDSQNENDNESDEIFDFVINNIEWSTLMFFFSLFIIMEAMAKLGLISFLGKQITIFIDQLPAGAWRSIGALTIVLWSSGLASSCIDNVPFTSMMIKILGAVVIEKQAVTVDDLTQVRPLKPLVFALAFGASFGGNATIIGASANLVTAGISGKHRYPISFNRFFKFASPITLISLAIANIYLVLVFVAFGL